jgi:hypothetical protein
VSGPGGGLPVAAVLGTVAADRADPSVVTSFRDDGAA